MDFDLDEAVLTARNGGAPLTDWEETKRWAEGVLRIAHPARRRQFSEMANRRLTDLRNEVRELRGRGKRQEAEGEK